MNLTFTCHLYDFEYNFYLLTASVPAICKTVTIRLTLQDCEEGLNEIMCILRRVLDSK